MAPVESPRLTEVAPWSLVRILLTMNIFCDRCSSVNMGRTSVHGRGNKLMFFFATTSRSTLGPKWVQMAVTLGPKRPWVEARH